MFGNLTVGQLRAILLFIAFIWLVTLFAQLKLFEISRTLKDIRSRLAVQSPTGPREVQNREHADAATDVR